MHLSLSIKKTAVAIVVAAILVVAGVYMGAFYWEREGIRKTMDDSVVRTALNLQAIGYIREGKTKDAIALLSSMNESNVVYLMRYDDVEPEDHQFIKRKKKVLANLSKEWTDHPRGKDDSLKSDPEWQRYQKDIENYLKQNQ